MHKYHKDMTSPTGLKDIFVFGSNLAGRHGSGSARAAMDHFGAEYGVSDGITGHSYGIPTCDTNIHPLPLKFIKVCVDELIHYAAIHREVTFFVTRIGCGIAGFDDKEIASLFNVAVIHNFDNFDFPEEWKPFLEEHLTNGD